MKQALAILGVILVVVIIFVVTIQMRGCIHYNLFYKRYQKPLEKRIEQLEERIDALEKQEDVTNDL